MKNISKSETYIEMALHALGIEAEQQDFLENIFQKNN